MKILWTVHTNVCLISTMHRFTSSQLIFWINKTFRTKLLVKWIVYRSSLKTDRVHTFKRTELNECNGKIRAIKRSVTCIVPSDSESLQKRFVKRIRIVYIEILWSKLFISLKQKQTNVLERTGARQLWVYG